MSALPREAEDSTSSSPDYVVFLLPKVCYEKRLRPTSILLVAVAALLCSRYLEQDATVAEVVADVRPQYSTAQSCGFVHDASTASAVQSIVDSIIVYSRDTIDANRYSFNTQM